MPSLMSWNADRDEELGKRDDDYMATRRRYPSTSWTSRKGPGQPSSPRSRRRTIIIILLVGALLFVYHSTRSDGLPQGSESFTNPISRSYDIVSPKTPQTPPPPPGSKPSIRGSSRKDSAAELEGPAKHYFSGPIKFFNLKKSLEKARVTNGHRDQNRNVLFAASSLKSVTNLLPLVCEMAKENRNYAHLAFLGRDSLPIEDVLAMNGVDVKECAAYFHDGRPDYSEYSTDVRAEASVVGAMNHIFTWVHPQAVITDDESVEDGFFMRGIRGKMEELDRPVIELPARKYAEFGWMTRLTSSALKNWHRPKIEILVHSPPGASGGLARLLKSLSSADYGGFHIPKLTVELPSGDDSTLRSFMNDFSWPPPEQSKSDAPNMLQVHKRIPSAKMSAEESSIRFVESYYPSHYVDDHVLVLSPNAQLSPSYFHYLMFSLLQARYSAYIPPQQDIFAGLALTTSNELLGGSGKLEPPMLAESGKNARSASEESSTIASPFLWQSPSSDAMLVICERWVEFHDYLHLRLKTAHEHSDIEAPKKMVAEKYPSWLEYFVELSQARGWTFLYPPASEAGAWVTIHNELAKTPEEFRKPVVKGKVSAETEPELSEDDFLSAATFSKTAPEGPVTGARQPIHEMLPFRGVLPAMDELPMVSLAGKPVDDLTSALVAATKNAKTFRATLGACPADRAEILSNRVWGRAGDLFCQPGVEQLEELTPKDLKLIWRSTLGDWEDEDPDFIPRGKPKKLDAPKKMDSQFSGQEDALKTPRKDTEVERPADKADVAKKEEAPVVAEQAATEQDTKDAPAKEGAPAPDKAESKPAAAADAKEDDEALERLQTKKLSHEAKEVGS